MSVADYPQVGRGWAFPPRWELIPGETVAADAAALTVNDGIAHIHEAMRIILQTERGSRVMRPTLGAGVNRYVFESRTADVCYRLGHDVERALLLGEPRVIVDSVVAVPAGDADDRIDVTIEYRIDRHRRPTSLVVPFYLEAAS